MHRCKTIGCLTVMTLEPGEDFCLECSRTQAQFLRAVESVTSVTKSPFKRLGELYPKYFKDVSNLTEVDVYEIHELFQVQDYSGAIHHASKKLLLSGVRTGGKSKYQDIKEARDTLNRWLQIHASEAETT